MFNIGQAIKDLRQAVGLSQEELASGICNQAQISNLENNNATPSAMLLNQIATKLGVDMNYFFEMQESHKIEYLQNSKKYIRKSIRIRDYENLYNTILSEKKHPYYQETENLQFLLWHEAICIHYVKKESTRALEMLNKALQMTNNRKYYTEQEIEILISISIIETETKLYTKSEDDFKKALDSFKNTPQITNPSIELRIIYGLSKLLTDTGRYQESLDYSLKGIRLCKQLETLYVLGELHYQCGSNYARMGEKEKAISAFDKAINIFELQSNHLYVQLVKKYRAELLGIEES
ncbi:XRE family transcriptional regulator [Robertmurraya yapensis]|uniref:XRE family transcriptional regulator n=1 Tax=Bacillus yapensis TaxID=2492960 RepID=A0A3S0IF21_9BACI|nr:helix-turn-helix domain-containing protein [Bacillus yapensis]RTR34025.1 XRE family transcriptional regulator [Bacillus yapensis]TKS97343.1 helix-turn-helix domain-containing protein [Bacillus yapensis]